MVWAALDCPGGWAVIGAGRPYVLGRIAVHVDQMPEPDDRCVVRGALASAEGRKALVHTTLYGTDGAVLARARATWIAARRLSTPRSAPIGGRTSTGGTGRRQRQRQRHLPGARPATALEGKLPPASRPAVTWIASTMPT